MKMNKLMKVALTPIVAIFSITTLNLANISQASANDLALNLCTYAQGDDRLRMRNKLRDERFRLRQVYESVKCNGMSLIQFAASNGSEDIAEFMISQLPSSSLESYEYADWLEQNGYSKRIIDAVKNR